MVLLGLLLGGCFAGPSQDAPPAEQSGLPGIYLVNSGGIEQVSDVPGIVQTSDRAFDVDVMQLLQEDVAYLVLVQALANLTLRTEQNSNLLVPGLSPFQSDEDTADFCIFQSQEALVPGDLYVQRAQGREAQGVDRPASERSFAWLWLAAGDLPISFGYGSSFAFSSQLDEGDWFLLSGGESGIDEQTFHADGNVWTLDLTADGPLRLLVVPVAPLLCGNGLARFQDVVAAGPVYSGGSLDGKATYGATAGFDADLLQGELDAPDPRSAFNAGSLLYRDEKVDLSVGSRVWRTTYDLVPHGLRNDQWLGSPSWILAGLSIPHPDEVGLDNGNR